MESILNQFTLLQTFIALFIVLATIQIIGKRIPLHDRRPKDIPLDGLRGYLAFAVFLHHSIFWYNYAHNGGQFIMNPNHFYFNYGRDAVAIFFMITAYLFWGKLLTTNKHPINWRQFYTNRIFRIMPLYLFMTVIVIFISFQQTGFHIRQSPFKLCRSLFIWLTGKIINAPAAINAYEHTDLITSGVTWTLSLEWLFYFTLPVWGLLIYRIPINKLKLFIFVLMYGVIFYYFNKNAYGTTYVFSYHMLCFLSGIIAAYISKSQKIDQFCRTVWCSAIVALCIIGFIFYAQPYTYKAWILMSVAFLFIACGNDLFGIFSSAVSRRLGQLSYSIYLMHGILLFITINYILTVQKTAQMEIWQYSILLYVLSCCIIVFASFTFSKIELPGMAFGKKVSEKIKL